MEKADQQFNNKKPSQEVAESEHVSVNVISLNLSEPPPIELPMSFASLIINKNLIGK
jgi:hypothetical protein